MNDSDKKRISKLKELCEKATPAPWYDDGYRVYGESPETLLDRRNAPVIFDYKYLDAGKPENGELIVAFRTAIPFLIELVERQEKQIAVMKEAIYLAINDWDLQHEDSNGNLDRLREALTEAEKLEEEK